MKNTKITFLHTTEYDPAMADCNYNQETQTVVFGECYDFSDYLNNADVKFEINEDCEEEYIVIDEDGEPIGERFYIVCIAATDEEI